MGNVAVYKRGTTDFYNQGLGVLSDVLTSELTQVVASSGSVSQQLVMEYPLDGYLAKELVEGALVRVSVSKDKGDFGVFEISDTLKDDGGTLTIYADAYYNRILRMSFDNGGVFRTFPSVQLALDEARSTITGFPAGFALTSNLGKAVDLSEKTYETFGDFLEALVSASGGNVKYTLNGIQIYSALGKDITNITLRDDMNTTSVKVKTDYSGIINKVIPVLPGKDDTGNNTQDTVVGQVVTSKYGQQFLDYWAGKVIAFDTQDLANSYFDRTHADRPVQTVEVSPLDMDEDFSSINIFDRITLYSTKLDYKNKLRVSERVFDTLSEEVKSFKLGSSTANVFNQINEQNETLFNNVKNVTNALISANGKGLDYFGQAQPKNPREGDLWFWDDGTDSGIKQFVDGEWVSLVELATAKKVADSVAKALLDATNYSDKLVADNAEQVNRTLSDVQAKQADLTAQQAELDTKAQGYANKALADAKADTLATATQTAKDASDALAKAKTDLTTSLNKEVTDRANAVTALDTKAKGYADTAKADAIATANASVTKEVTDRQKAITDLDKKSTDAVNQAKTDAQSALDALQVGGRNLVIKDKLVKGWMRDGVVSSSTIAYAMTTDFVAVAPNSSLVAQIWYDNTQFDVTNNYLRVAFYDSNKTYITRTPLAGTGSTTYNKWLIATPANTAFVRVSFDWLGDGYGHAKLEIGNKATDYTQAPEDIVLDYTTKHNVISQSLTQYQATNDGKVTKAQSDATQALGLVATKVSQTDYNTKTGDLDSKYTAVKQTADQASTDIVAIKSTNTSQDTKINTLTSDVSGTKQSISDIQKEQGKQSTKINTIQTDVSGTKQDISDIKDANGVQDGKIASISTTVDGLSSSFSTYKTTNDGKVAKAQADITANSTAISQKVSQTAYDAKTGQLQTDLNTTTTTANQAKTDIVAIKKTDTEQDARMTTIESDANGIKTTVSSLQTTANTQAGNISTLQQRADGFDATVTKVNTQLNDLSQVNMVVNSEFSPDLAGWYIRGTQTLLSDGPNSSDVGFNKSGHVVLDTTNGTGTGNVNYTSMAYPVTPSSIISVSVELKASVSGTNPQIGFIYYDANMNAVAGQRGGVPVTTDYKLWKYTGTAIPATAKYVSFDILISSVYKAKYVMSQPMMVIGSTVGAYVQGQYNNNGATAKAQLTADNATLSINNYKTDADGRISKAQADIIVNANAITQKVSQSDYNAKTGDLTTKVNTAQSTADSATSTIGAYKTSNDARVASAESKITANANAITSKVSQTDYNTKTGQIDGQISTINQTAGKISQTVSDVKAQVDGLSVGGRNLYLNTKALWMGGIGNNGSKVTLTLEAFDSTTNMWHLVAPQQAYAYAGIYLGQGVIQPGDNWALSFDVKGTGNWSSNGARIENSTVTKSVEPLTTSWARVSSTGKRVSAGGAVIFYFDLTNSPLDVYIKLPKLENGTMPTAWSPAPEDTDNKISTVSQTVGSISSIVSDPTTGLTKRVQTAEGSISTVQSNVSDLQSKQTQTANGLTTEISNRQTGDTNTLTQAKDFTTSSISNSESGMRSQITQTSDAILGKVGAVNLFPNSEFEKDYGYRDKNGSVTTLSLAQKNDIDGRLNGTVTVVSDAAAWQGYWARNIPVYGGQSYSASVLVHYTNGGLSNGYALLDVWFVDKDGNRISTGTIGTGGSNNSATGQVSSPWWVKLYIENLIAPTNAVNMQVSLLVNNAGAGQTAMFTQPMVTATEKLQHYTPNNDITTQLALLKDNWSIGIADNAGAITSGIVGNSSNMSLISNNVTINSPQTQIKGTAWINSAMIGNGQIGNAQIGDASISSAKIMNLDVNKITGNVSNWVLSQWTSATGSKVTIDGNGLYFSPGTSRMTADGFEGWRRESSGNYVAMGLLGTYAWETDQDINGVGLIAKYYGVPHNDPNDPYRNETWGGDTIAIGALEPEIGRGYNYVTPYMIFPSSSGIGEKYFQGNGNDTIVMSRWLSIYTGLNMRGHSIVNSSGYSLKENFSPVSGADALDIFDNTEIMTYDYKPDSDDIDARTLANMQDKVGFVINDNGESPFTTDPRLVRYGNTRDDSVTVGYLMSAVKELHAKVKELETKLEAQK